MVVSIGITVGLIWFAPSITTQRSVYVEGELIAPRYSQVGLLYRVWHGVDEDWPWDDEFPEDAEAVSGSWAGFPFPVVQRRVEYPHFDMRTFTGDHVRIPSYWFPVEFHNELGLYRPHWIGLIADALFWGGLLWLMRCVWRTILARRRIRRGRCPRCSYDLSGLNNAECCPECGERRLSKTAMRPSTRS